MGGRAAVRVDQLAIEAVVGADACTADTTGLAPGLQENTRDPLTELCGGGSTSHKLDLDGER